MELSIGIVARGQRSIKSSAPARIKEEEIGTRILTRKFEEALEFEEIWSRSRFSNDKSRFNPPIYILPLGAVV
jgi:hypothetical protein